MATRDARAWAVISEKIKSFGDTPEAFFALPVAENPRPRPKPAPEANPAAPENGPEPEPDQPDQPEEDNGFRFRPQ